MKLSIKNKLLGTFFLLILFFLIAAVMGYGNSENLRRSAKRNSDLFKEFRLIAELDRGLRDVKPILINYQNTPNKKLQEKYITTWRRYQTKSNRLSSHNLLPEGKTLLSQMKRHGKLSKQQTDLLFSRSSNFNHIESLKKAQEHNQKLINLLDRFRDIDKKEILDNQDQINQAQNAARMLAFSFLGIVLLALSAIVLLIRYVTAPLSKLHDGVKYISHGHFDRRLSIKTGDEIEDLAETFNQMVANLFEEEQTAARLQKRLLPPKKIRVKGIRLHAQQVQAKVVGGDWYDYYHSDNSISFLIADASGKGMAGALLATLAMSSIRSEAKTPETIESVLRKTNKTIESRLGAGNFITLFHANLSLDTHELSYINCGHELPLLYRADSDNWSFLQSRSSLPIGISGIHFHPRQERIHLQHGDKILLYTDGLHDARDPERRFFNMDNIMAWLDQKNHYPIDLIIDGLLEKALKFCQRQVSDDITLLGLEIVVDSSLNKKINAAGNQSSSLATR